MNRREAILSALGIFAVALAARVYFAAQIVFPKPEDTAYYVAVARNLLNGRGLVFDALWSYGTPPLEVPRAAFEVWLPLPTFLDAIPMAIAGQTFAAAQVSSILIGALVPVLAWRLAADVAQELELPVGRARTLAVGAGLTTAVYLPLLLHSSLPDSTMPFTVLALVACLLMTRILRAAGRARILDPRLLALGVAIGLAALTRNEAIWLGVVWAGLVWFTGDRPMADRVRLIGVVAVVAALVFAPWALRNWQAFGSPLPSQTATNALSITGLDIFAWNDPPTLQRYLAVGWQALLEMRVVGFLHNLLNVLLLLGIPISILGVISIPLVWPSRSLRPLAWYSLITFLFTCLVFPVSTTWGTFLHAAGPVHVWLVIGALLLLDAVIARVGQMRGWTRPVAWLGPALAIFGSALFSLALLSTFGRGSIETRDYYAQLGARMAEAGHPLDASAGPVISDFPIWLADTQGARALALPDEPPVDVFDLARAFPGHALRGPLRGRRPRALAGGHRRRRTVERVLPRDRHRHGADARVRDRLPVKPDPYTRTPMDAVIEAQEAERSRLAREVHDGPAQALSNAIFQVEHVERIVESDPALARAELRYLRDMLRRQLGEVRAVVSQLRPPLLDELGLNASILDAVEHMRTLTGLPIGTALDAEADALSSGTSTVVLRVVQEALQNVHKHAAASSASVATRIEGADWVVEVTDDGRGFDPDSIAAHGRRNYGLQFMRERAELIGARLDVRSRPDGGTVVRLAIPTPG